MKYFIAPIIAVAAMIAPCHAASAPANLTGKTVVLNYTKAQYLYQDEDGATMGWTPYSVAVKKRNSGAEAFYALSLKPKATRNILPISTPAKGGKYVYSKTGADTGTIEVNGGGDCARSISIKFTSATTGVAVEEVAAGCFTGTCKNITVTIK